MDISLALITHAAWPLTTLICLFLLRKELSELISRLKGLKAGALELLMSEELHSTSLNESQLKAISNLSAEDIDLFLLVSYSEAIGFRYELPIPQEVFKTRMAILHETGLIEVLNSENPGTDIRHNITPMGFQVRSLLLRGSKQLLQKAV